MNCKSFLLVIFALTATSLFAGSDWPMWRYDEGRRGVAEITLPGNPALLWTRQMDEPKRAWPFQFEDYYTGGNPDRIGKLSFDISYEPVVGDGRLYVPSMISDRVTAYSAADGKELWRFYAGGPVRFAPVYDSGRVYFISDDGYLYCLDAATGDMLWNYFGSYSARMVLGNERMISMWPARGAPVISDGVIYFAAGVMPFEGIFVHAVDAFSGNKIWTNSTIGTLWNLHQHGGAYSYGGPSPQGYLAVSGEKLIVPGGRTPPAVFDLATGEFLYFNQASGMVGKGAGGYRVFASGDWYFNHGIMYALEDGAQFGHVPGDVLTRDAFIGVSDNHIVAHKSELSETAAEIEDRLQRGAIAKRYEIEELWQTEVENITRLFFKTDSHYVVSMNDGSTAALISAGGDGRPGRTAWEYDIDGEIWSMFGGDGKLFAVTRDGRIYCFGSSYPQPVMHYAHKTAALQADSLSKVHAAEIIEASGATGGYGMVVGGGDRDLVAALVENSALHIVVIEPDRNVANDLKKYFDQHGIYGRRVSVVNGKQADAAFLPYIYNLIVVTGEMPGDEFISTAFNSLRPYGGKMYLPGSGGNFRSFELVNASMESIRDFTMITREGPLPGAGQWTHQYGSAANRTYSDDNLVKPPLGTLWFGGPSNLNVLPRHHNGPIPQVAGGRLFILGIETLSARCVYTGRELWIREFPEIGHPFTDLALEERFWNGQEVYMSNHPGANFIGSPYVSLEDAVYVIHKERLISLDPASGDILVEFRLPPVPGLEIEEFGHLMVWDDYLITTIGPQIFDEGKVGETENWNATSSTYLLVMDRHSGEVLWSRKAGKGFRHNAIVAGNERLYLVDGLSEGVIEIMQRRGIEDFQPSEMMALDIRTGREIWKTDESVFGTWLGYYDDKNILLQGGRRGQRGAPGDEPNERLIAHNGLTGNVIWENTQRYSGPVGMHPDMIIPGRPGEPVFSPYTGENIIREHPLTGQNYEWNWHKYYGCGTMNSSRYLIMFRSGTSGYADLLNFGGTGNLGGFRSGCTNSMVAADGILNAPEYTRTCTCSYPLQTSVGLVHMPDTGIEMWTLNRLEEGNEAIRSLGINFGGQGNRRENGVLWLEYPKVYGAGPDIPVEIESGSHAWFRNHATWIQGGERDYDWVGSYGIEGIKSVSVGLIPENVPGEKTYTVTLYFTEPEELSTGQRLFDVLLQGNKVLENFDIVQEAGGTRRVIKKQFHGIRVEDKLTIGFSGKVNSAVISGIEMVIDEQVAEGNI